MKPILFLASLLTGFSYMSAAPSEIKSISMYSISTNKTYKIEIENTPYFLRVGRNNPEELGINRKSEIESFLIAEKMGIAPKLYSYQIESGILISEYIEGTSPSDEGIKDKNFIDKVLHNLRLLHSYQLRDENIHHDTVFHRNSFLLDEYKKLGYTIEDRFQIWLNTRGLFEENYYSHFSSSICHGDLYRHNILETADGKIYFIDWEYSYYGFLIDDLGKLCATNQFDESLQQYVIESYFDGFSSRYYKKLKQNIFVQQMNFFLWCKIQAKNHPENSSSFLSLADMVAEIIDGLQDHILTDLSEIK